MRRVLPVLPALLSLALPAAAADGVDLVGTWYVLVHYKDDGSPNPEQERWEDRVWVFEKKGRRMRWTEYPIVVFDDETGRFERRHTGQYARVLHYWEPDAGQRADIADGLQVNSRGSKRKILRGSDAKGWASRRASAVASASVVTYSELWKIEGLPTRPVFSRADFLSGARTENMEGVTRYATTEVRDGGDLLVGTYTRDGRRHGTFRMMRAGEAGPLEGAKDLEERQRQALRGRLDGNAEALADQARALYAEGLGRTGTILSRSDMAQMEVLGWRLFRQEVSAEVAEKRVIERTAELAWGFAPSDARHDDSVRYRWPFEAGVRARVLRGEVERTMQLDSGEELFRAMGRRHAFDFALPEGTPVLAARDGIVRRVVDDYGPGGPELEKAWQANGVWISHSDGTIAEYSHLAKDVEVEVGQSVEAGDVIGRSGASGRVEEPSLHFAVLVVGDEGMPRTVPVRFADGTPDGVVPVAGRSYGGE